MKYISIGIMGLLLASCAGLPDPCSIETSAHGIYVLFIGPLRPADARAREAKFYAEVQALCSAGASPTRINNASASAQAARQK